MLEASDLEVGESACQPRKPPLTLLESADGRLLIGAPKHQRGGALKTPSKSMSRGTAKVP